MRPTLMMMLLLSSTAATAADDGGTDCKIEIEKDDLLVRGKGLVVEAGRKIADAIALDGDVLVKKGAKVKNAIAINGNVRVEPGAEISGSVVTLGGKLEVAKGAKVEGSQVSLGSGLSVKGEDGEDININISVGGKNLAQELARPILEKLRNCRVIETSGKRDGGR
jgi:hypothetical protein